MQVTRDEFGGYCCKRTDQLSDANFEENICELLGIDIERKALEIVMKDIGKRGVPIGALAFNTPHSTSQIVQEDILVSTPSTKTQAFTPMPKATLFPVSDFRPTLKLSEVKLTSPDEKT